MKRITEKNADADHKILLSYINGVIREKYPKFLVILTDNEPEITIDILDNFGPNAGRCLSIPSQKDVSPINKVMYIEEIIKNFPKYLKKG
jgi:hypothetical protein